VKILIISDSHGHITNLRAVMEIAKKSNIKAVIHCGDWDNPESVKEVLSFDVPLYSILGNADIDSEIEDILKFESKKFDSHLLRLDLDGRKIGVIHYANLKDEKLQEFDIVFSGHRHSKEEKMINLTKFIRPGALVNGINFAVYETITSVVEFFNE